MKIVRVTLIRGLAMEFYYTYVDTIMQSRLENLISFTGFIRGKF